jgi:hypothetical protein
MRWQAFLALSLVALAACDKEPPPKPRKAAVLMFTAKVPGSFVIDTSGTEEAEHLTMVAPVSGDSVANFYRTWLPRNHWILTNDRSAGEVIDLQARGGPVGSSTMWVHVERQDTLSARYTLIVSTPTSPLDSAEVRIGPSYRRDTMPPAPGVQKN